MLERYAWKNNKKHRYYNITVLPDMLNEYVLVCNWGSVITRRGNCKKYAFAAQNEALDFVMQMMKRRKRRGYELITSPLVNNPNAQLQ